MRGLATAHANGGAGRGDKYQGSGDPGLPESIDRRQTHVVTDEREEGADSDDEPIWRAIVTTPLPVAAIDAGRSWVEPAT